MTPTPAVRICTCNELHGQTGLHSFLEFFSTLVENEFYCADDRLIFMELPDGWLILIKASLDSDGIAHLQSIAFCPTARHEQRIALWQAAIAWAKSEGAVAMEICCSSDSADQAVLDELGFPVTTEIVTLGRERAEIVEPLDPAIRQTSLNAEQLALVELVERTLIDSLDIPESIPLRQPEHLLRSWLEESPSDEVVSLVAESENELVGLIVATLGRYADDITGYQINYLGVAADQRRQGWGSRLLTQLLRLVQQRGVAKVSVFTDRRNHPAIQLYQRFGFREFTELRIPIVFQRIEETL